MTDTYLYAASVAPFVQHYTAIAGQPPRIAYLGPETILKDGKYGVAVAAEYGFSKAKRTANIDEALEWLEVRRTKD